MAVLETDLDRAMTELEGLELQMERVVARVVGKRAEVAQLRESIARENQSGLPAARTDAIVSVLRRNTLPMSPSEVTEALNDAGRSDQLSSVTATLAHLRNATRVIRQGRGRYVAV